MPLSKTISPVDGLDSLEHRMKGVLVFGKKYSLSISIMQNYENIHNQTNAKAKTTPEVGSRL